MSRTSSIDREVGSRLTMKRIEFGLDRPTFAKTVGILPEELAQFESGDTRINAYTMQKICSALGLSPLFFFDTWLNKSDLSSGEPTGLISCEQSFDADPALQERNIANQSVF